MYSLLKRPNSINSRININWTLTKTKNDFSIEMFQENHTRLHFHYSCRCGLNSTDTSPKESWDIMGKASSLNVLTLLSMCMHWYQSNAINVHALISIECNQHLRKFLYGRFCWLYIRFCTNEFSTITHVTLPYVWVALNWALMTDPKNERVLSKLM